MNWSRFSAASDRRKSRSIWRSSAATVCFASSSGPTRTGEASVMVSSLRGAKRRSNSESSLRAMDCFAPLAMTAEPMTASLPSFTDHEIFRIWRADAARWLPAAIDIARTHGLSCTAPQVFSTGTNLVVALDERLILKIFPPMLRRQFVSERGTLAQLHGRVRVPIPEIVFEGERDGWPYLVITRLTGRPGCRRVAIASGRRQGARAFSNRRDHRRGAACFARCARAD